MEQDLLIKTIGGRIRIWLCKNEGYRSFYKLENFAQNQEILLTNAEYNELINREKISRRNMQIKELKKELAEYEEASNKQYREDKRQGRLDN